MKKVIVFDWSGTIDKTSVVDKAAQARLKTLGIKKDHSYIKKAQKTYSHYDLTRKAVKKFTGVTNKKEIDTIMVRLFQLHYLNQINKLKRKAIRNDVVNVIKKIKKSKEYRLALVTGIEPYTILHTLKILKIDKLFDQVCAGSFATGETNLSLIKKVKGKIALVVGDREKDMQAGKALKAKTCLVTWGHHAPEAKKYANFIAKKSTDILKAIKSLK